MTRFRRGWFGALGTLAVVVAMLGGCSVLSVPDTTYGPPDRRADVLIPAVLPDVLAGGRAMELDDVFGIGETFRARGSAGRMWRGSMLVRMIVYRYGDVGAARKSFERNAPHLEHADDWGPNVHPTVISPFQVGGADQAQLEAPDGPDLRESAQWSYWARYDEYVVFVELRFGSEWYGRGVDPERARQALQPIDARIRSQLAAGADRKPELQPPGPARPPRPTGPWERGLWPRSPTPTCDGLCVPPTVDLSPRTSSPPPATVGQ